MTRRFTLALVWLAAFVSAPAFAQTAAPTNDDCLACHADASLTRANGTSVGVAADAYGQSVHGSLSCVDCHQDLAAQAEWPHPEQLKPVSCATCHEDPVAKYAVSAHAQARAERRGSRAATCVDCHGMHDIRPSSDIVSRTHHLNLPQTCGRCHGDPQFIRREGIRIGDVVSRFQDSIHGRAIAKSGLTVAPNCSDCHGSHDIRKSEVHESRVFRGNVPNTCGRCHEGILRDYAGSIHGTRQHEGLTAAAVCSDCHSAHGIARTDQPEFQLGVVQECGTCHADKAKTYADTFHGQVTALGFERVARCADCHGAHDIRPARDAASRVAPAQLVRTCAQCHPAANANFVKYDPHADKDDRARNPALFYTSRFMSGLLLVVFTFFGLHTFLWGMRSLRDRGSAAS